MNITRRRWARRMLPHVYRFGLWLAHGQPRHAEERKAWADYLRQIRKEEYSFGRDE